MQILTDTAAIVATATLHPDPELRRLLGLRIQSLAEFDDVDLAELMHVVVLEPGDSAAELHLRTNGLCPEVIETHNHWFELTFVTGQGGAGFVVYVPTAHPELLALLG
jgi:hypothetical protein